MLFPSWFLLPQVTLDHISGTADSVSVDSVSVDSVSVDSVQGQQKQQQVQVQAVTAWALLRKLSSSDDANDSRLAQLWLRHVMARALQECKVCKVEVWRELCVDVKCLCSCCWRRRSRRRNSGLWMEAAIHLNPS